jgi:hypothetical protein
MRGSGVRILFAAPKKFVKSRAYEREYPAPAPCARLHCAQFCTHRNAWIRGSNLPRIIKTSRGRHIRDGGCSRTWFRSSRSTSEQCVDQGFESSRRRDDSESKFRTREFDFGGWIGRRANASSSNSMIRPINISRGLACGESLNN